MSDKQRDYWSDCSQVYFLDGYGWGITEKGGRICLGLEEDILRFFETGELNGKFHQKQEEVLLRITEFRKEEEYGESTIRTANLVRANNNGGAGANKKAVRLPTARKRLPQCPSNKKR